MRAETEADGRIALIQSDIWIGFPRAEQVLDRLQGLIDMPRQTRMPGLLVYGASGIGKTMIARNLSRRYPPEYDPESGITRTALLLLQAPPAPDERRFYMHILAAVGAPSSALSLRAQSVASLEVRVVGLLRDLGLRMIMIDEVHNLLAGNRSPDDGAGRVPVVSRLLSAWHSDQTVAEVMGIRLPDLRHPTPFDPRQA